MKLERLSTPHACVLAGALALSAGCGGAQNSGDDDRPMLPRLDGAWTVYDADGAVDGTLLFDGDRVGATAEGITYRGAWAATPSGPTGYTVVLSFDSASTDGVGEFFGTLSNITLHLSYDGRRVFALQPNGAWTAWTRLSAQSL